MPISHPPTPGSALWVTAHPRAESLNGRLFREGVEALSTRYVVATSDLYAQDFNPVLGDGDLGSLAGVPGNLAQQAGKSYTAGQLPPEVQGEQAKLASAELLILQFPLWWYGPPAILKGWFDRVLTDSFAYGDLDPELGIPRRYGDGGLAGRRALVVVTAGEDERTIGPRGLSGDIDTLLFPITHGVLWYTGIESLDLHVVYDADTLDPARAEREIKRLRERLDSLDAETPRRFRSLRDGDYRGTRALRADILPGRTDFGIHLAD
ncbi:NAD(P)H-dependent oxidoreductase [Arthrobacter luteolus]|uniref:NAD(P)H-dependent oxidoreductase n=1 Tax=Arthrobacter luteolus TaxID=98672 RepID=UPI000829C7AC|nr:NAD(P)H-dependent oxidoreductase [Arthrobacter luteolus]